MKAAPAIYGLLAEFEGPVQLLEAARRTRDAGYKRIDAYSPYPIEGLTHALGHRHRNRLPHLVLAGGLTGLVAGAGMQWFASAVHYPINVGGRPLFGWPSAIPITFETTVLFAALTAVFAMLALNGLPMPYHPLFNVDRFALASRDRFFLCIEATDPQFDPAETRRFLESLSPAGVNEVPH
jgi:hypothetical protein